MKARIVTAAVAVAVLATGSGAVITVATAYASETADTAVSAQAATVAAQPNATVAAQPNATVAAEPAATVAAQPSKTPAPSGTPEPGQTTTPPPKPTKNPDKPGETYKGSATFYSPGLGACGKVIKDSDFAVALDPTMFGPGYPSSNCGRKVVITYKGKSITATVLDEAPGAGRYGLDLTPGAFKAIAPLDKARVDVTWRFAK